MAIPADFALLWANLPQWFDAQEVKPPPSQPVTLKAFPQIKGLTIPKDWETCCIQMSHALNMCGLHVNYSNKQRVLTDTAGNEYMLDVTEMRGYLDKLYGASVNIARVDANGKLTPRWALKASIAGRQALLAFGGRHIDLWDGAKIHGENYIPEAIWEAKTAVSDGIFLWDVEGAAASAPTPP